MKLFTALMIFALVACVCNATSPAPVEEYVEHPENDGKIKTTDN